MKPWSEVTVRRDDERMFMLTNPYGYLVNINHPEIKPLLRSFKLAKGIPVTDPLTDNERLSFERQITKRFSREYNHWLGKYEFLMPFKTLERVELLEEVDFYKLCRENKAKTLDEIVKEEQEEYASPAERARAFKAKCERLKAGG